MFVFDFCQVPRLPKFRPAEHKRAMKGRPISGEEFDRMLAKTPEVVGNAAAPSWRYLLRGIWETGLRLDEAMHFSWDLPGTIRPQWRRGALPIIVIPGTRQKNRDDDEIPLLPGAEALLLETVPELRTGWVFEPECLSGNPKKVRGRRMTTQWVSQVIVAIGRVAGVIVEPERGERSKKAKPLPPKPNKFARRAKGYVPPKYASAHDLRRSLADRLEAAGVDPLIIARVMRHRSYETTRRHYAGGNIQRDAATIRAILGKNEGPNCGANSGDWSDQAKDGSRR